MSTGSVRLLVLQSVAAAVFPLAAQMIEGTVTDPHGFPMAGVRVEIAASGERAWTGPRGRYRISAAGVAGDSCTVSAIADEFEKVEREVHGLQAGRVTGADLMFQQVRKAVTSIQVIGESVETLREIPGAVFLIPKEELDVSVPMDANEVLRRVPGLVLRDVTSGASGT